VDVDLLKICRVKVLNTSYDMESGVLFCLIDAPDRDSVEKHHSKFGIKCGWITQVKMTAGYDKSDGEEDQSSPLPI
jgi:hypothetical protein